MRPLLLCTMLAMAGCEAASTHPDARPCNSPPHGLSIVEVMIDPGGTDTGGEWLELFNASSRDIELAGLTLYASETAGAEHSLVLEKYAVPAGGHFTLGDSRAPSLPEWLDASYGTSLGSFSQAGGVVGLRCGEVTLDEFRWVRPIKSGRSRMLDRGTMAWCDAPLTVAYAGANHGSPGKPNPPCVTASTCLDHGVPRALVTPQERDVIITEVMAAPRVATDSVGEWFELLSKASVDLNGVIVATSTGSSTLDDPTCLHVEAGQFVVIARSADPFINGGLPPPLAHFSGTLSSGNERLRLQLGDAGIDEVAFYKSAPGVSWQLGAEWTDAQHNDDPVNFCASTRAWPDGGGDLGSPGAANAPCHEQRPHVDAGLSSDAASCIDLVTQRPRPVAAASPGGLVITEVMADPTAVSDEMGEWFEVLATSAFDLNGLKLGNDGSSTSTLTAAECRGVQAGTTLLFARHADTMLNGGLPPVDGIFTFSLTNSGARFVRVLGGARELARLSYSGATPGASIQQDPATARACVTPPSIRYGSSASTDRGTPGRPNVACP